MTEAKRERVNYLYFKLNWDFIKLMAEIASYSEQKYELAENYTFSELTGDRAPINHIPEHYRSYVNNKEHDHFIDVKYHLAAIAYNAMMEYYYYTLRGPITPLFKVDADAL